MPIKTIFLDRDGVINKEVNYLYKIKYFEFIDGIFEACSYFKMLGYKIIIITNQSGIARGYFKENDYHNLSESINPFEMRTLITRTEVGFFLSVLETSFV